QRVAVAPHRRAARHRPVHRGGLHQAGDGQARRPYPYRSRRARRRVAAMTPPRLVLDLESDLAAAMRGLERGGWRVQHGFTVPDEPWDLAPGRVVLAGDVASEAAARAVLMAAVRGAGLAVRLDRSQPWGSSLPRRPGPPGGPAGGAGRLHAHPGA